MHYFHSGLFFYDERSFTLTILAMYSLWRLGWSGGELIGKLVRSHGVGGRGEVAYPTDFVDGYEGSCDVAGAQVQAIAVYEEGGEDVYRLF